MSAIDLNAQVLDPHSCSLCAEDGHTVASVAAVVMPWGTVTLVCETHRARHAAKASLWPAKDAIRLMLRGQS